ncbi:TonB-dependent receptor domain-containing protein [Flavisolibacter nicotianae]|uniref:TonB-dependent receptor domain-containing protein n=1 Tax=Flavisolibacter nicotianae TaxID=2364882 RepID=UPI000EAFFC2A|nr:TonB-dependent receptor [Flavisolibacter nicotianae]
MKKIFTCVLAGMLTAAAFAQAGKGKATVTVLNGQNAPVEGATVELLRSKDSALVKSAISDKAGAAEIDGITPSGYMVRISVVGYTPSYSKTFDVKEGETVSVPSIAMKEKAENQLQGVTVSARKPFIQRLNDRLVVNVENSVVNAGSAAIDVLERSPGITLDQNDNIILRGKQGVIVMIDGRPSPMTGADLANYLRGLPVNAIERIEIITNPSSKYDAAGNSGIIDIRLKKDQRLGSNGTLTAGYSQGVYPKWNAGSTFNYRNKGVNVFGNYNYAYREMLNHLLINRNFYTNGVFKGSDDKDNFMFMNLKSHTARLGADFFPSKNTIVGVVVNGNFNGFNRRADINTVVNDLSFQPDFRFNSISTNKDHFDNVFANINLKQKLDSNGKELTADVDYGVFKNGSLTRTSSLFYNLNGSKRKEDDILDGDQAGKLTLKTAKVDLTNPLKNGAKLEAGVKTSYVSSDNDAKFYNVTPSEITVDATKTNRFYYEEYNNAAYTNFSKEYKKFNLQLGLRGELTNLRTRQVKGDRQYSKDYFQLFPSAFFNYKLKPEQTLGVSVSRRIDRPGYSELNPFLFQVDATIYSTGNPLLKPQMTWSYELNYTLKNLNFTFAYSHTTDPQNGVLAKILDVIPTFEIKPGQDSNITVQIPVNLESSDYLGFTASAPVRINKWWSMMNNFNLFYNKFNGNLSGAQLNDGKPAANIRTNNTFTFKKGWTAELNANLNTGGRYGYMVFQPQWGLGTGVQKTLLDGKGTLRFNITDIFWTSLPKARVEYKGSYVENWHAYRDSRVASLTFTYRFGNSKVQAARRRTTASEEERQRAGGN